MRRASLSGALICAVACAAGCGGSTHATTTTAATATPRTTATATATDTSASASASTTTDATPVVSPPVAVYRRDLTAVLDRFEQGNRPIGPDIRVSAVAPQVRTRTAAFADAVARMKALVPPPGLQRAHAAAITAFTHQYAAYRVLDRALTAHPHLSQDALVGTIHSMALRLAATAPADKAALNALTRAAGVPFSTS